MSDSRSILLKLSVRDADVVRRELVAMGTAGESAFARLDAAAQRATGTGGAVTRGGGGGGGSGMAGFRSVVRQAGFQLQDFAVQVQGGTSALTALSQQGSQFLGVFGAGGAIAGAALTVGLLAAQLLGVGTTGDAAGKQIEDAFKAAVEQMERLRDLAERVDDFMLSADERALALARRTRATLLESGQAELRQLANQQDDASNQMLAAATLFQRVQAQRARLEIELQQASPRARAGIESDLREIQGNEFDARARMQGAQREANRITAAIAALREQENRLQTELSASEREAAGRYGPQPPTRAPQDPRAGKLDAGQTQRPLNVSLREDAAAWDAYAQSVNLANAGLEGASAVLARYEQQQNTLRDALSRGIISEQEFGAEVERTSVRLAEQLDEIKARASGANDITRSLGLTFTSAFEDAISKGKSLRDVLKGIASDLARLVIRKTITEPLGNAASKAIGSVDWSTVFSFGGARAGGGPVTGGMSYIVGERGPELFTPASAGSITPNGAIGGVTVYHSPTFNIGGGEGGLSPRQRAEALAMAQAANADLVQRLSRGQPLRARIA